MDLGACVTATLADREHWLRSSDMDIIWQEPGTPVKVLADAAGVRLVLVNLVRNAIEAVVGQSVERRLVRVTVGPGPTLSVFDSGPGIPPEQARNIFDPFTTSKAGTGRGIGLSLALASARRMGADLEVVSNPGSGTVFTLRLLPCPGEKPT
jgi:C4-dicarboxylate-specific signal transduction histidine kinase